MGDPPPTPKEILSPHISVREPDDPGSSQGPMVGACSLCRRITAWDEKYRFWFLHENYAFPETLEPLTRSLGFCFFHGEHAAGDPSGQSSLTLVHEVLSRRVGSILSRDRSGRSGGEPSRSPFAVPAACPACGDRDDAAGRALSSLIPEIESDGPDRLLLPDTLCLPHLRALVSRLSLPLLLRFLPLYESTLASAMGRVSGECTPTPTGDTARGSDHDDPLRLALQLAAGEEGTARFFPPRIRNPVPPATRDPVSDFLEDLSTGEECPVCREMRRAWTEWVGWLEENGSGRENVRDLLPTCPVHLHATYLQSRPDLAALSLHNVLGLACHRIRQGVAALASPPSPDRKTARFAIGRFLGKDRRGSEIRRFVGSPLPCPVCHRLSVARDRSLHLLFVLLESPKHQARFEGGYGLCLRHFSRSLALKPSRIVRAILTEVLAARLALLQWEMEESMRKDAWIFRPEAAGTERTAWKRAVRRFSGSFPERDG